MSTTFYIIVYLIVSATRVDIIFNKVELEEYKDHKLGTIERKSFGNSPEALKQMDAVIDKFKDNNPVHDIFIDISAKNQGGWMGGLLYGAPGVPTLADVEAYARSKNYPKVDDEVYVGFSQDREIKNVKRNK